MENAFRDMNVVKCYIDDIVVHSPDTASHRDVLQKFFQRCIEVSLTLHGEKFYIGAGEIEIMGHVIGQFGCFENAFRSRLHCYSVNY